MSAVAAPGVVTTIRVLDTDAIGNPEWHYGLHFTTTHTSDLRLLFNSMDQEWVVKSFTACCNVDYEVRTVEVSYMDQYGGARTVTEYPLHCTKCGSSVPEDRFGSFYDADLKDWLIRQIHPAVNVLEAEFAALELRDYISDLVLLVRQQEHLGRFRGRTEVIERLRVKFGEKQDVYGDFDEYE